MAGFVCDDIHTLHALYSSNMRHRRLDIRKMETIE